MPTVEQNIRWWNLRKDWSNGGDEWSEDWGGVAAQWFGSVLPRIQPFMPAPTILEIAPGFGRWTQYLLQYCERLIVIDLAEKCIEACKERFRSYSHIEYYVNDGKSLAMVRDNSLDFVFSYDSLVHAESDVLEAYISQLAKKLSPDGVAFLHHSNVGSYVKPGTGKLPFYVHNRRIGGKSMTARLFKQYCENAGLQCMAQELINWRSGYLNDCFSVLTRKNSVWSSPNRVLVNRNFMREVQRLKLMSRLYPTVPAGGKTPAKRDQNGRGTGDAATVSKLTLAEGIIREQGPRGLASAVRERLRRFLRTADMSRMGGWLFRSFDRYAGDVRKRLVCPVCRGHVEMVGEDLLCRRCDDLYL